MKSIYTPEFISEQHREGTVKVQAQINMMRLVRFLQATLEENELINSADIDQINNVYYEVLESMPKYAKDDLLHG